MYTDKINKSLRLQTSSEYKADRHSFPGVIAVRITGKSAEQIYLED